MAGVVLMVLVENKVEEVVVLVGVIEVRFIVFFTKKPSLLGRQFEQDLPAFTQVGDLVTPQHSTWMCGDTPTTKSTSFLSISKVIFTTGNQLFLALAVVHGILQGRYTDFCTHQGCTMDFE